MWNMEADRHTYPYTLQDKISSRKVDKSYRVVCLENRYLKVVVLPELGGHVYSLYDKTAGQEMLYSNGVIKPAMLAFRGAWIACGIEYNFCTTGASHTVTGNLELHGVTKSMTTAFGRTPTAVSRYTLATWNGSIGRSGL